MTTLEEGRELAERILDALREDRLTLAVAESCTGGLVASIITDVPGASDVFDRGLVAYTERAKMQELRIDRTLLEDEDPVSPEIARAMAEGLRELTGASWAVSTTGVAGPTGGTPQTPVGTVYIAVAGPHAGEVAVQEHRFTGDRLEVKRAAAVQALHDLLERVEA